MAEEEPKESETPTEEAEAQEAPSAAPEGAEEVLAEGEAASNENTEEPNQEDETANTPQTEEDESEEKLILDPSRAPKWLKVLKAVDIMALPYSDINFPQDLYEKALIELRSRGWTWFRIKMLHLWIVSPLFWLPFFEYIEPPINIKKLALRYLVFLFGIISTIGFAFLAVSIIPYEYLFWPVLVSAISGLISLHLVISHLDFRPWFAAYKEMRHKFKEENKAAKITAKKKAEARKKRLKQKKAKLKAEKAAAKKK
ncbi:MAG: hypothetical protein H7A33_05060 [Deltaproteobacteria bacterium]|nr:hypothetical protein [Deltaproteobacteria bacterium]